MPASPSHAWSPVPRAAFLATAATLGVLAGFGVREGMPMIVLGGAGLRLRGVPEFVTPDRGVGPTAILGALHTGALAYAWGLLAARLAWRLGGWRGPAAVAALAVAIVAVDPQLPAFLRLGAGAPSAGQRALCVAALAAAAVLGTRLAPPASRRVSDAPPLSDTTPDRPVPDLPVPDVPEARDAANDRAVGE